VACFSFYANKTITTGEGGMAVTDDAELARRMRSLSLHGLSKDAWGRFDVQGAWDYRILAAGYKYNLTDVAAAIGVHQLARAEEMRVARQAVATAYDERFAALAELELPPRHADRVHAWHVYQVKLRPGALSIDRDVFLAKLGERGIGTSVHYRPLHLHPLYEERGWRPQDLPVASEVWRRSVSLPIFPGMEDDEVDAVAAAVTELVRRHRR
jgi:perosamine synthetase